MVHFLGSTSLRRSSISVCFSLVLICCSLLDWLMINMIWGEQRSFTHKYKLYNKCYICFCTAICTKTARMLLDIIVIIGTLACSANSFTIYYTYCCFILANSLPSHCKIRWIQCLWSSHSVQLIFPLLLLRPDGVIDPWLLSFWQKTLSVYPPPAGLAPIREEEKYVFHII